MCILQVVVFLVFLTSNKPKLTKHTLMTKHYLLTLLLSFFLSLSVAGQNCETPTALNVTGITGTSAVLSWVQPVTASVAEIYVGPAGSAPITGQGVIAQVSPFVITGLTPCTSYVFYIRSGCNPPDFSPWVGPFNFTTTSGLTCSTTANGNTITTAVSGGTPPFQYAINGGPSIPGSNVFTVNVNPGTYVIQAIDANGCSCSSTITIQNSNFSVSIIPTMDIPTSTLIASVSGGVGPFTFQWQLNGTLIAGATEESLAVLGTPGVYSVTVTDNNGLTATATFIFDANAPIANDDSFTIYSINGNFATSSYSVLNNDTLGSSTSLPSMTVLDAPAGFTLNAEGTVSVLSGTPAGTYTLTYQLCSTLTPGLCDTAMAVITVVNEGILMNAFIDTNTNGTQEAGEPVFTQGQFGYELNDSGTVNYASSSSGNYLINESNPANSYDLTYTINPAVASQYTLATSSYTNVSVVANSGVEVYNFPVTQIPFTDLQVSVFPYGAPPRPGFTYQNMILYKNNGNQMIASGTVIFTKNNAVSITNVSPAATITTATGFTYDFTNLLPGETRYIYVLMQVPTMPTVALGDVLTNNASITIPAGDIIISNNSSSLSQIIVGSYDPNDKSEAHGGKIVFADFTSNDYLTYTIQFENTGTYNAENVSIEDYLDAKLDETSIKMISASHGYTLNRVGNFLNWSFIGIDLPPSVVNTTTGKGYVSFQVKPKAGYAIGDLIPNTASIFFDFNPAIVTNTFSTEFVTSLSVAKFDHAVFTAYPNPTQGFVTIALKDQANTIDSVQVNDVLGKTVQSKTVHDSTAVIDLSSLSKGIYFIKVLSEGLEKVLKVVKQ